MSTKPIPQKAELKTTDLGVDSLGPGGGGRSAKFLPNEKLLLPKVTAFSHTPTGEMCLFCCLFDVGLFFFVI